MQRDGGPGGPGGPGGAGNPVGGSFTGPAETLEIIGDHCYAYNRQDTDNTETDLIDFTTGNFYAVLNIQPQMIGNTSDNYQFAVYIGEQIVARCEIKDTSTGTPFELIPIVVPSYTRCRMSARNVASSSSINMGYTVTGRIYRG